MQVESALLRLARQLLNPTGAETGGSSSAVEMVPVMQVTIRSGMNLLQFRDLTVGRDEWAWKVGVKLTSRPTPLQPSSGSPGSSSTPRSSLRALPSCTCNVRPVGVSRASRFRALLGEKSLRCRDGVMRESSCALPLPPTVSRFWLTHQTRTGRPNEGLPTRPLCHPPRSLSIRRPAVHQATRSARHGPRWRTATAHDDARRAVSNRKGRTWIEDYRNGYLLDLCPFWKGCELPSAR